jgi:Ca2+-binding RTX toxin-like protein
VAVADSFTIRPGEVLTIAAPGLIGNDTDADGDALILFAVSQGSQGGSVTAVTNGSFTYTPPTGFTGTDTFTYVAFDGFEASAPATVTINVVNSAPVAVADSFTIRPGEVLDIAAPGLIGNDTDADGDALILAATSQGSQGGTVSAFTNGSFTYTPPAGFVGTDTFEYEASDGFENSGRGTVTITVVAANAAPTDIALSNASVLENLPDGTLVGLLSATDADAGETFAFSFAPGGNVGGLFRIDGNRLLTDAELDHEAAATRSATLRVTDSAGNTYDEAFTIAVGNVAEGGPADPIAPVTINGPGFTVSNGNAGTPATATPSGPALGTGTLSPAIDTAPITLPGETTPRARIENEDDWNGLKNLVLGPSFWTPALGTDVLLANFVDVRWDLSTAPAVDFDLLVVGGKRGGVTLAGGDDALTWAFHSNEGAWANTATISGGAGNDTLAFTTTGLSTVDNALLADNPDPSNGPDWNPGYDGRFSTAAADGGLGNDVITVAARVRLVADGGEGNDALTGGARNDALRGGDGNDVLAGGLGPDRFLFDAADGTDAITDFTRWQGDKVVLEGPGALAFSGNSFTFGATSVTATNGHLWAAADFLFA